MKSKILVILFCTVSLVGCEKKTTMKEMPTEQQDALNQALPTQTELTLMKAGEKTQASKPEAMEANAPAQITTAVPIANQLQETSAQQPTSEEIQQALQNANLYHGKIDGSIGPKTKKAIKEFQEQNNLSADGKVGPRTWAKLQPFLNQATTTGSPEAKD